MKFAVLSKNAIFAVALSLAPMVGTFAAESVNVPSHVNINTASAEEIAEALNGVGLSKAEEIVRYRESNGAFVHIDELVNVKGVGMKTVDKNREHIFLQDTSKNSDD